MQSPSFNGSKPAKTSHPFASHEAALRSLFRSSPPCSIDAPEVQALHGTALDAATGICRRIRFEPYRTQAAVAVHIWQRELQRKIPQSYDPSRPLFPYTYQALRFIILRLARESGLGRKTRLKSIPLAGEPAAPGNDPLYLAQLSEIPELVAKLPHSLRIVVVMRYFHDRSTKEIAAALAIAENAVRLRIHRAMQRLRSTFELS